MLQNIEIRVIEFNITPNSQQEIYNLFLLKNEEDELKRIQLILFKTKFRIICYFTSQKILVVILSFSFTAL